MEEDPLNNNTSTTIVPQVSSDSSEYFAIVDISGTTSINEKHAENNENQLCLEELYTVPTAISDLKCFVCGTEFDDVAKLHVHMSMKHKGVKALRCEYCSKAFATTKTLYVHLQQQHSDRDDKYLCWQCKIYFISATNLLDHNNCVHKKTLHCSKCVKCFSQMSELTIHERSHSFHKPLQCEQCNETFSTQSSLSLHVKRVHEFNVNHCALCDYSFGKESELNAHIYVHIDDDKLYECPDCGELFDDLNIFVEHLRIHERTPVTTNQLKKDIEEYLVNETDDSIDESHNFLDNAIMDDIHDDNVNIDDNESKYDLTKLGVTLSYTCPICEKMYEDITEFNTHCESHKSLVKTVSSECKSSSKPRVEMLKTKQPKVSRAPVSLKWQENDNKVRNFSCEQCNRSFTMASTLSLHLRRTHLGIKPYKCHVCEWAFAQSSDLIRHVRKHTSMSTISGERPYSCATCGARFTQNRNLRNHMKIHTDEPSVCKYCNKKFLIDTSLVQHLKKHEGPNAINCSVCKIPFSNQSYLDQHTKRCAKKEKHQCTQCEKSFFKSGDLVKHNRKHTGERPYICSVCNKTFSHPTSLRNHNAVHTKLKPFICSYCGQAFSFHGNLKIHLLSHSGEKPYSCPTCSKRFARSANLKEHIKIHTGEKNYKCLICEKSFTNSSTFSKHKKIHSGEKNHHCSVYEKSFSQHAHLVKHTRIHTNEKPYGCNVCDKYFRRSDTLANHLRTHLKDDRNNQQKNVVVSRVLDTQKSFSCDQLQEQHVPLSTVDVQLVQQTGQTIEDVPQIIYTITAPTITGAMADQMNMELMNDAQSNPHFIITSL